MLSEGDFKRGVDLIISREIYGRAEENIRVQGQIIKAHDARLPTGIW
jgi:hypothetical protein